jgi:rhamnosyltransferase
VHRQSTSSGGDAKPYALVAAERAVREHLQRRGEHAEVCADPQTLSCEVRFALPDPPPMVSVIVFSDANTAPACMASISQKADYPAFEVIQCHGPSRHAAIHRAVAEQARGQIVVLLDANADITHPDWMRHLVSHAVRPQIGAVGGKVLDGRGRLLHAGLVLGMGRGAGPVHQGLEPTEQGYFGRAALAQNFSALASTCLAIRRDVFLQAGGFDNTAFSGLLADADFCLRVGELGLRHVWTPLSVVALRDQRSQGLVDDAQTGDAPPLQGPDAARIETARFARRWGHLLLSDPCYSPNLTLEGGHFQTGFPSRVPSLPPPTLPATCRFGLVIPSRDAGLLWDKVLSGILAQQLIRPQVLIVDSGSRDGTVEMAREHGLEVLQIDPESFSHGGTRQMALERLDCDVVFFLTHDAVLASPFSLALLAQALDDPKVAVAYGRQLPFAHARLNGRILRHFNYPRWSEQRSFADRERLGIRCAFNSNSFAAYRVQALRAVGGFDPDIPVGEDFVACAALLQAGHQSAYVAHATVLHSHDYTLAEEVSRYRLIGRMHRMRWDLIQTFGRAEREGWVLVRRELCEVMRREPLGLPLSVLRIAARYLGYRSGLSG